MLFAHSHNPADVAAMIVESVFDALFKGDMMEQDVVPFMVIFSIYFAVKAVICFFLSRKLKAIPKSHHRIHPDMAWLIMTPFLTSIAFNFMIYPFVSRSFQGYAKEKQNDAVGDCGEAYAWFYCGLNLLNLILLWTAPILGILVGLPSFLFLVLYLCKINQVSALLKNDIGSPRSD
jgi:hypothetical protein